MGEAKICSDLAHLRKVRKKCTDYSLNHILLTSAQWNRWSLIAHFFAHSYLGYKSAIFCLFDSFCQNRKMRRSNCLPLHLRTFWSLCASAKDLNKSWLPPVFCLHCWKMSFVDRFSFRPRMMPLRTLKRLASTYSTFSNVAQAKNSISRRLNTSWATTRNNFNYISHEVVFRLALYVMSSRFFSIAFNLSSCIYFFGVCLEAVKW